MKTLLIVLACSTFCHQSKFKAGDCTNDIDDRVSPTYRKIIDVRTEEYTYQIANRVEDITKHLYNGGDIEEFDRRNIKVECPKWFK